MRAFMTGSELQAARTRLGLSAAEMAAELGLTPGAYTVRRGRGLPRVLPRAGGGPRGERAARVRVDAADARDASDAVAGEAAGAGRACATPRGSLPDLRGARSVPSAALPECPSAPAARVDAGARSLLELGGSAPRVAPTGRVGRGGTGRDDQYPPGVRAARRGARSRQARHAPRRAAARRSRRRVRGSGLRARRTAVTPRGGRRALPGRR